MRAVPGQVAFEQGEALDGEWLRSERPAPFREIPGGARLRPPVAGKCDVGMEGTAFRFDTGQNAGPVDFRCQCRNGCLGLNTGP